MNWEKRSKFCPAVMCKGGKFDKNSCRNNFEESVLQFIFLHWWQKAHSYNFLHPKHVSKTYFTEARFSTFPMIILKKKKFRNSLKNGQNSLKIKPSSNR